MVIDNLCCMKTICLIRHAKTHPAGWQEDDFDRKLTDRGKEDATKMSNLLKQKEIIPELLISSPAKRTKTTAKIFAKTLGIEVSSILFENSLYAAEQEAYLKTIQRLDSSVDTIAIIGHNPGITDFANHICREVRLDHMPTASVFIFNTDVSTWNKVSSENCRFKLFLNPSEK